jgi:hypothetical protein
VDSDCSHRSFRQPLVPTLVYLSYKDCRSRLLLPLPSSWFHPIRSLACAFPSVHTRRPTTMGGTAEQFCSRDSMYRFQDEAEMPPPLPLVDAEEVRNTAMTWQQKQDFGTAVVSDINFITSTGFIPPPRNFTSSCFPKGCMNLHNTRLTSELVFSLLTQSFFTSASLPHLTPPYPIGQSLTGNRRRMSAKPRVFIGSHWTSMQSRIRP